MNTTDRWNALLNTLRELDFHLPLAIVPVGADVQTVAVQDLLQADSNMLRTLVADVAERMESTHLPAAASLFQKYYAGALLASILTPMTYAGIGLLADADSTEIVLVNGFPKQIVLREKHKPLLLPQRSNDLARLLPEDGWVSAESDASLRMSVFHALFDKNLGPLIYRIASEFNLSPKVMWGNIGNYFDYLYGLLCNREDIREAAFTDREALMNGDGFEGPPLGETYTKRLLNDLEPPQEVRVRTTCCLWYKVSGKPKCTTCPLVSDSERAQLIAAYHSGGKK